MDLRLPRVLAAMVVGLGLAVAGATFQGLLRNPLADPYVLGTASGAALGAAIARADPGPDRDLRVRAAPRPRVRRRADRRSWVVYRLSRVGGLAPMTSLLLTGYAVGSLLAAGLAMAMYLSGANLRQIFFYLLGSLAGVSWQQLAVAAPIILVATRGDPPARPLAGRVPARRGGGRPSRRGRAPRARDPARPGVARDRGGRDDRRADRVRRAGRAARRAAGRGTRARGRCCRCRRCSGRACSRSPTSARGCSGRSRSAS